MVTCVDLENGRADYLTYITEKKCKPIILGINEKNAPLLYTHGYKAPRAGRWHNPQPCTDDCKAGDHLPLPYFYKSNSINDFKRKYFVLRIYLIWMLYETYKYISVNIVPEICGEKRRRMI